MNTHSKPSQPPRISLSITAQGVGGVAIDGRAVDFERCVIVAEKGAPPMVQITLPKGADLYATVDTDGEPDIRHSSLPSDTADKELTP